MLTYLPASKVRSQIQDLGFQLVAEATVVSDGKFWSKSVYASRGETVTVSDELGAVTYLRDPVITVFGRMQTVDKIAAFLESHQP